MGNVCCRTEEIDFQRDVELYHFYLMRVIGKGAYGKVRIVQHKGTHREYALKCISKNRCIELKAANNMISERRLLERINHPLVVNLRYAFQDDDNLFMVLDLMLGGDLRFQLEQAPEHRLPEERVRFYVAEIALALSYLHRRRIAHRDIKPDNVLLDQHGHCHLTDFNIATQFDASRPLRWSKAGSLAYMAPEMLAKCGYSHSVDWWSLGVLAYELLFGKRPFHGQTGDDLVSAILNDTLTFPDDIEISDDCIDVIKKLLERSPMQRLGAGGIEDFKAHPWFAHLDWDALETKTATAPFIPSTDIPNFDAVHELEELLLEEEPLRYSRRTNMAIDDEDKSEEAEARRLMTAKFHAYDFTRPRPTDHLFRRLGNQLDQAKYKQQGYQVVSNQESQTSSNFAPSDKSA
ncbi:kinase-like protein [Syncephalastrum racemosum]|uniref:Kinase-like protein n=1 Tax=Syncephalastrum racemosum TaxID=13706 RepID=A0A1X2GZS0_SYNRA|nr:kinase-like protein [Syncephalastrum racemosum]